MNEHDLTEQEQSKLAKITILVLAIAAGGMMTGYGIAVDSIWLIGAGLGFIVPSELMVLHKLMNR